MTQARVIGAGPAGLMAAEEMARAGMRVTVVEAMPSPGRKLLMAGKSGLNLTKDEAPAAFAAAYEPVHPALRPMLAAFGPAEVVAWAEGLGQRCFTGSTGRVFPREMKASPLLRAWLRRLDRMGVEIRTRWRWSGWEDGALTFQTPDGRHVLRPGVTVIATGGASWRRLGSDGAWAAWMPDGAVAPFRPANAGLRVEWSDHMARHFGLPVKGVALIAEDRISGDRRERGEFVISARGLEGGGIYAVSRAVREGAPLAIDLLPDLDIEDVAQRLGRPRGKTSVANHLRRAVRLDPARIALLREFAGPLPRDLAPLLKRLPVRHAGLRPLDEAISTAGGLRFETLDDGAMIRDRPGVFCAGEMLDWEAPTGGYLLTACLASGRWAGRAAAQWAQGRRSPAAPFRATGG